MPYQTRTVYGDRIGLYYTGDFGAKGLILFSGKHRVCCPSQGGLKTLLRAAAARTIDDLPIGVVRLRR